MSRTHHNSLRRSLSWDAWQQHDAFDEQLSTPAIQNALARARTQLRPIFTQHARFAEDGGLPTVPLSFLLANLRRAHIIPPLTSHNYQLGLQLCISPDLHSPPHSPSKNHSNQRIHFDTFLQAFAFSIFCYPIEHCSAAISSASLSLDDQLLAQCFANDLGTALYRFVDSCRESSEHNLGTLHQFQANAAENGSLSSSVSTLPKSELERQNIQEQDTGHRIHTQRCEDHPTTTPLKHSEPNQSQMTFRDQQTGPQRGVPRLSGRGSSNPVTPERFYTPRCNFPAASPRRLPAHTFASSPAPRQWFTPRHSVAKMSPDVMRQPTAFSANSLGIQTAANLEMSNLLDTEHDLVSACGENIVSLADSPRADEALPVEYEGGSSDIILLDEVQGSEKDAPSSPASHFQSPEISDRVSCHAQLSPDDGRKLTFFDTDDEGNLSDDSSRYESDGERSTPALMLSQVEMFGQEIEEPGESTDLEGEDIKDPSESTAFSAQEIETPDESISFESQEPEARDELIAFECREINAPEESKGFDSQEIETPEESIAFESQEIEALDDSVPFDGQEMEELGDAINVQIDDIVTQTEPDTKGSVCDGKPSDSESVCAEGGDGERNSENQPESEDNTASEIDVCLKRTSMSPAALFDEKTGFVSHDPSFDFESVLRMNATSPGRSDNCRSDIGFDSLGECEQAELLYSCGNVSDSSELSMRTRETYSRLLDSYIETGSFGNNLVSSNGFTTDEFTPPAECCLNLESIMEEACQEEEQVDSHVQDPLSSHAVPEHMLLNRIQEVHDEDSSHADEQILSHGSVEVLKEENSHHHEHTLSNTSVLIHGEEITHPDEHMLSNTSVQVHREEITHPDEHMLSNTPVQVHREENTHPDEHIPSNTPVQVHREENTHPDEHILSNTLVQVHREEITHPDEHMLSNTSVQVHEKENSHPHEHMLSNTSVHIYGYENPHPDEHLESNRSAEVHGEENSYPDEHTLPNRSVEVRQEDNSNPDYQRGTENDPQDFERSVEDKHTTDTISHTPFKSETETVGNDTAVAHSRSIDACCEEIVDPHACAPLHDKDVITSNQRVLQPDETSATSAVPSKDALQNATAELSPEDFDVIHKPVKTLVSFDLFSSSPLGSVCTKTSEDQRESILRTRVLSPAHRKPRDADQTSVRIAARDKFELSQPTIVVRCNGHDTESHILAALRENTELCRMLREEVELRRRSDSICSRIRNMLEWMIIIGILVSVVFVVLDNWMARVRFTNVLM